MESDRTRVAANLRRHTQRLGELLGYAPRFKDVLTAVVWRNEIPIALRIDHAPGRVWAKMVSDARYGHSQEAMEGDGFTTIDELCIFLGLDEIDDDIDWLVRQAPGIQEFKPALDG